MRRCCCLLLLSTLLLLRALAQEDAYFLVTKMSPAYCLAACDDGSVVMDPCKLTSKHQMWFQEEHAGFVDQAGRSAFILTSVATQNSLRHGCGENEQVDSVQMSNISDSFLWTRSPDLGNGYTTIRSYENIGLNLDVDHADYKREGVKYHNRLILHSWNKGDNQLWAMISACSLGC